jgi:HSP20 family protein
MLTLWNPLARRTSSSLVPVTRELDRLVSEMERAFDEMALPAMGWNFDALVPAADVVETDEAVTVRMDLPGHDPKAIHVEVENDVLTVRSERRSETSEKDGRMHRRERSYGLYARSFALPAVVDASKAEARYENGVLTVTLPKHAEARPKRIAVKVRS